MTSPRVAWEPDQPHAALRTRAGRFVRWCTPRTFPSKLLGSALAAGLGVFLLVAPLLAVARQAMLLAIAWLVAASAELVETRLLTLLPVDPVYGGAGLRVLGGIEPRGLAVAGSPGLLLHQLLPTIFYPPELAAAGAAVSALVDPGVTVLARVLTALLATSVLVAVASTAGRRARRPALVIAARLAQIWLLIDLAHEADLSVRDLEATGLPFALAAFAPVDAHGQRVLLTSYLDGLPGAAVGVANAGLAVIGCVLAATVLQAAARLLAWPMRHRRLPRWSATVRSIRINRRRAIPIRLRHLTSIAPLATMAGRLWPLPIRTGLANFAALVLVAVVLSVSPFRSLAEGETAVLIGPAAAHDDEATPDTTPPLAADAGAGDSESVGTMPADDPGETDGVAGVHAPFRVGGRSGGRTEHCARCGCSPITPAPWRQTSPWLRPQGAVSWPSKAAATSSRSASTASRASSEAWATTPGTPSFPRISVANSTGATSARCARSA